MEDQGRINEKLFAVVTKLPFPFRKREAVMRYVWQKGHQDGITSIAFVPAKEQVDYGGNLGKLVQATTSSLLRISSIVVALSVRTAKPTFAVENRPM